jgi:hypothetical protein
MAFQQLGEVAKDIQEVHNGQETQSQDGDFNNHAGLPSSQGELQEDDQEDEP